MICNKKIIYIFEGLCYSIAITDSQKIIDPYDSKLSIFKNKSYEIQTNSSSDIIYFHFDFAQSTAPQLDKIKQQDLKDDL
jgi:hypothetical protein